MQRIWPYLLYEDGEAAIEWLERAFGFRLKEKMSGSGGGLHAELEVHADGTTVYLGTPTSGFEGPAARGTTSMVYVIVDDVDAHHDRAKAEGAEVFEELVDMPFGHRRYSARDPQGHEWSFASLI